MNLINIFEYIVPLFIRVDNESFQRELQNLNVFKADFSNWRTEISLERNIHLIIFLCLTGLIIGFFVGGVVRYKVVKKCSKK